MSDIDWTINNEHEPSVSITLNGTTLDEKHLINFTSVKQTEGGYIVADVECETLEGNTLWLKGKFGFQNGALSLMKAAQGKKKTLSTDMIEGNSFVFTKVSSEVSVTGYAYLWTVE